MIHTCQEIYILVKEVDVSIVTPHAICLSMQPVLEFQVTIKDSYTNAHSIPIHYYSMYTTRQTQHHTHQHSTLMVNAAQYHHIIWQKKERLRFIFILRNSNREITNSLTQLKELHSDITRPGRDNKISTYQHHAQFHYNNHNKCVYKNYTVINQYHIMYSVHLRRVILKGELHKIL